MKYGYTPLLFDGQYWSEAYGYLGSYYKSYQKARQEIDWLMRTYPEKYIGWQIERVNIDEDGFLEGGRVTIAQSK